MAETWQLWVMNDESKQRERKRTIGFGEREQASERIESSVEFAKS